MTGSCNMNLMLRLCLMMIVLVVVSTTTAQTTIKCFDRSSNGKDKRGVILDCSNKVGKNNPYSIENWIRYHAFYDDGILANRVLHINLENNNFKYVFVFPSMTSLKKLSFKYNNISTIVDQALSKLPALEELDLSYNSLESKSVIIKYCLLY